MLDDFEDRKKDLSNLFQSYVKSNLNKYYFEIIKILKVILKSDKFPVDYIYSLIGDLMMEEPEIFIKDFYSKIINILPKFVNMEELDEYILKKYCFLDDEEILLKFKGKTASDDTIIKGRFYLTNHRLFGSGKRKSSGVFIYSSLILSVGLSIASAISSYKRRLSGSIGKDIPNLGLWGYQFPINEVTSLKRTQNLWLSYVKVWLTDQKVQRVSITITPSGSPIQRKNILTQIYDLLDAKMIKINCPDCNLLLSPRDPTVYTSFKKFKTNYYKCPNCRKWIKQGNLSTN
jgi:hypothetical protein